MTSSRFRRTGFGLLALGISMTVAFGTAGTAGAKKGKKSPTADVTVQLNQVVPTASNGPPPQQNGRLISTTTLGKKFKGKLIDDVNARITASGDDVGGLAVRLTAPNGDTVCLLGCSFGLFGKQIGPLTLDDETPVILSGQDPQNFQDPDQLFSPYAGTANPEGTLSDLDNGPAKGSWTLRAGNADPSNPVTISQWGIHVATHRPYLTK
jgi:subtilisin-like proprotein convertase family protein